MATEDSPSVVTDISTAAPTSVANPHRTQVGADYEWNLEGDVIRDLMMPPAS